jgi:hypothetical protein
MRACFAALLLLTFALPRVVSAQVRADQLLRTIGRLSAAVESLSPDVRPPQLKDAADWLSRRSTSTNPADISEAYLRSLERAADLLEAKPGKEVIADVTSELEAKVEHCRTLGIGMGGSVRLKVDTRTPSGPVSNWQVVYLLKIYERLSDASPNHFPRLSTPTEATVEPGRYWVWARDPATGRTSERSLLRVAGQKELLVDLPVP